MTGFNTVLKTFWDSFNFPVFLNGNVPDDTPFPYITMEAAQGAPFGGTFLTAIAWFDGKTATAGSDRASFLDAVQAAIPPEGVRLEAENGFFYLYQNQAGFLSYYDDPDKNTKVIGARVSYEIRYLL